MSTTGQVSPEQERVPKCVRCKQLHHEWQEYQLMLRAFNIKAKRHIEEPKIYDATHGLNMWAVSADGMERAPTDATKYIVCLGCAIQAAEEDRYDEVYRGKVKDSRQHIALFVLHIQDGRVTGYRPSTGSVWNKDTHQFESKHDEESSGSRVSGE